MNVRATASRERAAPRKRDADATSAAILEAGKAQFARLGYDRTVMRDVAAEAGVDVALINRYFGGKEGLFTAALKASFHPDRILAWDRRTFASEIATMMADGAHVDEERAHSFQFLLRAATSPTTAPLLNVAIQERFLGPIRDWLGGEEAPARARAGGNVHWISGGTPHSRQGARRQRAKGLHPASDFDVRSNRAGTGDGLVSFDQPAG